MGRVYMVLFDNVGVAAAQDLFEATPADDKPVRFLGWNLSNVGGTNDAGDDDEEFWRLSIVRGHTTGGSGGSAATPQPANRNDAAAGFAAEVNNTTIASTAGTTIWAGGHNIRVPDVFWLPDPIMITASQADTTIVVRLLSTPGDSVSMSGCLFVEEL